MTEIVTFAPEKEFRIKAETVFQKHSELIKQVLPGSQVYHVGSTGVRGSLTKGDVDLQVRVTQEDFPKAKESLMAIYSLNTGSDQTSFFCAFEKEDEILPVGIQLTVNGSSVDNFRKVTQFFCEHPSYTEAYNHLKMEFEGEDMEEYRNEKSSFIAKILSTKEYEQLSKRMDLYEKVKFVEGETFLTIEETKNLTHSEMEELIDHMRIDPSIRSVKNVIVLVNSKFNSEIESLLESNDFELREENITVRKDLDNISIKEDVRYSFKSLNEISTSDFTRVWKESMVNSLNAPSSLNLDEQMRSVEVELGSTYKASCLVAYESDRPIGVVMPHIEPGTTNEGRLFYFGLVQSERGKGKSKQLHKQALEILKNDFDAAYYIGSTGKNNLPMLKTFQNSGCTIVESNKVYKRKV